jgi:hypothetical protein
MRISPTWEIIGNRKRRDRLITPSPGNREIIGEVDEYSQI